MKTIPTKNGELLCVEVPMEAYDINVGLFNVYYEIRTNQGMKVTVPMDIGGGRDKFSIIGTITNGALDFDAEPYVEKIGIKEPVKTDFGNVEFGSPYKCYNGIGFFNFSSDSFISLLTSHNIEYSGKKIVILSKK